MSNYEIQVQARNVFVGNEVKAKYHDVQEPMYKHNAFIEALPPLLNTSEVAKRLRRSPAYKEEERHFPPEQRLQAVQRLANLVIPMPRLLELEKRFYRMISNGYMPRNPLSAEWKRQMKSAFPEIDWGTEYYKPVIRSTASGFAIIGASGVGKTTAIESVLSLYPQVIRHSQYNGQSFHQAQIVWLKLECPMDGSTKGLCLNFFQSLDTILNTNYYKSLGKSRRTADELLPDMAALASTLGMGVLVIDEIQRLSIAKSGGAEKMLNFFVQLMNMIGIPVVLVGTFKALNILQREFAQARRGAGQGDLILTNFADDEIWDYFVNVLWNYQWTNVKTPLTPALRDALYDESQGIIDIAVKLYMLVQWRVIGEGNEKITPNLIHEVAKDSLKLAKPILNALRTKDMEVLSQVKDVLPLMRDFESYYHRARERVIVEGVLNTVRNQQSMVTNVIDEEQSPMIRVAQWLVDAGFEPEVARLCAKQAINRSGTQDALQQVMWDAFELAKENKSKNEVKKSIKKPHIKKKPYFENDLRSIVEKAKEKGIPPYEALQQAGYIKEAMEFHAV
ncbi:ATP-binding protein [Brevibacillus centrosporus]|uniref:ATP-binding protein n=1 Tax=Brevibacillus centrosporus TaxID=54910 RepID=UPI003B01C9BC